MKHLKHTLFEQKLEIEERNFQIKKIAEYEGDGLHENTDMD